MKKSKRGNVDPFIVMDVMENARKAEERGKDIVHMEVGQPGTPAPIDAQKELIKIMKNDSLGYTVALGIPELRKTRSGRIINVVSLAGKRPRNPKILGYSASKFAAMSLTNAIRISGWDDGVRATSVCPGMVRTRMTDEVTVPDGEFKMEPEAIAETISYALTLPNSAAVAEILVNSRLESMF